MDSSCAWNNITMRHCSSYGVFEHVGVCVFTVMRGRDTDFVLCRQRIGDDTPQNYVMVICAVNCEVWIFKLC